MPTSCAGRDHDWQELEAAARPADCVPVAATDPLYILYTSGTTGVPKGVVRDNGGHAVALHWSMRNIYGVKPDEVFWTASDVGWVVGHSYIVYGPLIYGCTSVMYEGKPVGTPDAGAFWRVIDQHDVRVFFTAPTAFRAIKREDPDGALLRTHDLSRFRALFLAGERADPPTVAWAEEQLKVPVIDHWWQTETGWPIGANCLGIEQLPVKHGSCTRAVPGWDVRVLEAEAVGEARELKTGRDRRACDQTAVAAGRAADAVAGRRALCAILSRRLSRAITRRPTPALSTTDGYIHVMTRTDDIINVAAHRLSTGEMEEVVAAHPDVAECAVMGVADPLKGQVPLGLLVLKAGVARPPAEIEDEVVALVRKRIGPVASFKTALVVERLPKTRSGKILRGTMRAIADGEIHRMPATIDDPAILGRDRRGAGARRVSDSPVDNQLHRRPASFETRPPGAPQDEVILSREFKKIPHLEETAQRASRRTRSADPATALLAREARTCGRPAGAYVSAGSLSSVPATVSAGRPLPRSARAIAGIDLLHRAQAEPDRVAGLDVGAVPMGAVAHRRNRRLGRADQLGDLRVGQFGVVAQQIGDRVGLVLALGDRGVARAACGGRIAAGSPAATV